MITPSFSLTATERVLPKLALDFTTAVLDSRVTFTRTTGAANPATYVNNNGFITAATNNEPRFDYDPVTLVCKGLLIEESRANAFTYSEDFSAVGWATTRASIGTDQATAPDNTSNGDKLIEDTSTNTHFMTRSAFSFTSGTSYSLSIYLKAAGRSRLRITSGNTTTWSAGATFNLANGTIVTTSFGTAQIQNAGNDWYRCTISGVAGATAATSVNFVLSNGVTESYTGDGISGVYIWGAQMEAGAFATSYIPTTTTALTRNADVATMTGTNFSDWFNATQGSFVTWADTINPASTGYILAATASGVFNDSINIYRSSSAARYAVYVGGTGQCSLANGTILANTQYKQAATYKQDSFTSVASLNRSVQSDNLGSVPSLARMELGLNATGGSQFLNGHLTKLFYWPQSLTNAEIVAFTN